MTLTSKLNLSQYQMNHEWSMNYELCKHVFIYLDVCDLKIRTHI
jgi:hypothetical protein